MSTTDFNALVDDISIISENCRIVASSLSEAYTLVGSDEKAIVKVPSQLLSSVLIHRKDGSVGILADIISNFRTIDRKPLGHLDTKCGKIVIPRWWPATPAITEKYGFPHRKGCDDLLVDAFILSSYWNRKILDTVDHLPTFPEWTD